MGECVNKYYILNDKVKKSEDFLQEFICSGSCIYEVIRIINKTPLFMDRHINRLHNSVKLTNIDVIIDDFEIMNRVQILIEENQCCDGNVKIVLTEDLLLLYFIKHNYPEEKMYIEGVHTILCHKSRKNPNAKVIDNSFRSKINKEIESKKAFEAILVDKEGFITEGSKSNIFMVKEDRIITAPVENVLPGVTRDVIIELCNKNNIEVVEEKVSYKDLPKLDALFISGTSPKVLPIKSVEGNNFNSSNNNLVVKIMKLYNEETLRNLENYSL